MALMDPSDVATTSAQSMEYSRITALKAKHSRERVSLALTKRPLSTLKLFAKAVLQQLRRLWRHIAAHRLSFLLCFLVALAASIVLYLNDGPHKLYIREWFSWSRFVGWWVVLGVASSIGFGSGLHTFVLYLGPHVAKFTMRATECGRVDLKCAPYDTAQWGLASSWALKACPQIGDPVYPLLASSSERYMVPLHSILYQVQLEIILWGIGTALGELPPYFMARQAQLAGDRLKELEPLVVSTGDLPRSSLFQRAKLWMINHFHNFGFFTILLFASVPNPLFDVAGFLCGQFLVPFWKFFTATLIGKALIKTHIQAVLIIMVCNPYVVELVGLGLAWLFSRVPGFAHLTPRVTSALDNAKSRFSYVNPPGPTAQWNGVAFAWNTIVFVMMLGFASSIVTSIAQNVLVEQQLSELDALEVEVQESFQSLNSGHDRKEK